MKIAILGSGGDAPGMNPAIKRFVEFAIQSGDEPYFIYGGLEGLIDAKIAKANYKDVAGILHRGGAIIGSSRSKRWYERVYRAKAYENLEKAGIEAIVVLGGDGSFRALEIFSQEFPINFVGIPTTIDNDIYGTISLGVDSASNVIRDAVDKIRDTASTFSRAFVIETMGRECGYLAAVSAVTSGAEVCVIPEVEFDKEVATKVLKKQIEDGRSYIIAIVAEGTKRTEEIAEWLERDIGMDTRVTILGHIQRGGSPTVQDRLLGFGFAVEAIEALHRGERGVVTLYDQGRFFTKPLHQVIDRPYQIDPHILELLNFIG